MWMGFFLTHVSNPYNIVLFLASFLGYVYKYNPISKKTKKTDTLQIM